jgi:tight adherence protein B
MMALVLAAVFLGTILLILAGYVAVNRRQLVAGDTLRARLAPSAPASVATSSILKDETTSGFVGLNRLLAGKDFTAALTAQIERSGSRLSVGEFVLLSLLCAGVGFLVGRSIGLLAAPLIAVACGYLPYLNLKRKATKRLDNFQAQLPEAIDMLVNAMKSGYSLQAAIKFAGEESPEPLGPEFARVYDEQRLGMDVRGALLALQERVSILDCRMFVTALLLQRETGGNLAEVLTNLATLMRERVGLRGQIDALTAEPKMSAVVLGLMPVALFLIVASINRDYMAPLWTTPGGRLLSLYALVSIVLGYLVMKKIGKIDI